MLEQKHSLPNSTPAMVYPELAQYVIHWFQVMLSELIEADARARPLGPSAMHDWADHPEGTVVASDEADDVVDVPVGVVVGDTARLLGRARASTWAGTARTAKSGARSRESIAVAGGRWVGVV